MDQLSQRKYSELLGVSHTAVAKAIRNGLINNGWDSVSKKIIVNIANEEWGNSVIQKTQKEKKADQPISFEESHLPKGATTPIPGEMSIGDARRLKEIYNAEMARVEALRQQGLYVEKDLVYKQLFEYGKQLRIDMQAIPGRIVDKILDTRDRFTVQNLIINEINDVLEKLAKPPQLC